MKLWKVLGGGLLALAIIWLPFRLVIDVAFWRAVAQHEETYGICAILFYNRIRSDV